MATVTTFLKLRVADNLDEDSTFNLNKIDTLAQNGLFDATGNLTLRSGTDIVLRPGSGTLGSFRMNHKLFDFNINACTLTLNNDISFVGTWQIPGANLLPAFSQSSLSLTSTSTDLLTLAASASMTAAQTYTFPAADGTNGQVLSTDGSGNFSFATVLTSSSIPQTLAEDWITVEGTNKVVTHNFNTTDIITQVYDNDCKEYIGLDDVTFTDNNNISLTVASAPGAGGFRVLLIEIL